MPRALQLARRAQRRRALQASLAALGPALTIASAISLAAILTDRLIGPGLEPWWLWFVIPALSAGLACGIALGIARRGSELSAASHVDAALALKDRIASALWFASAQRDDPFALLAREEGERAAESINLARALPIRFGRSWRIWPALLAAAICAGLFLPTLRLLDDSRPRALTPEQIAAQQTATSAIDEALQLVPEQPENPTVADLAATGETRNLLEDIRKDLDAGKASPDEALSHAAGVIDQLASKSRAAAESLQAQSDAARAALNSLPPPDEGAAPGANADSGSDPSADLTDSLRNGDLQAAQDALEELSEQLAALPSDDREETAQDLESLADALTQAANAAEERARKEAEQESQRLQQQGLAQSDADELARNAQDQQELERSLRERGLDPDAARRLAERLAEQQREREAQKQAAEDARRLAEAAREAAEDARNPSEPAKPEQPEAKPQQPQQPSDAPRDPAQHQEEPSQSQDQQQQNEDGQKQQGQESQNSSQNSSSQKPGQQQQQQPGDSPDPQSQNQSPQTTPGIESENPEAQPSPDATKPSQSGPPDPSKPPQPGQQQTDAPSPDGQQPGQQPQPGNQGQQQQQQPSPDGSPQQQQQAPGPDNKSLPDITPPDITPPDLSPRGLEAMKEALKKMQEREAQAQRESQRSRDMERQAREMLEKMSPEERERLQRWAAENMREGGGKADEPSESQRSGPRPGGSDSPENQTGQPSSGDQSRSGSDSDNPGASPQPLRTAPPGADARPNKTAPVDIRRPGENPRVAGEWMRPDDPDNPAARGDGAISTREMEEILKDAQESADQAVEDQVIPPRYRNVQEYFRKALERAEQQKAKDAEKAPPPPPAPDAKDVETKKP
jgi:hypothetical protein